MHLRHISAGNRSARRNLIIWPLSAALEQERSSLHCENWCYDSGMKVHYECEFEVSHASMGAEYIRGIIDAAIKAAQIIKPPTHNIASKIEAIIS